MPVWFVIELSNNIIMSIIVVPRRKFNNAEESDLWDVLTEQTRGSSESFLPANVTVKQVMDTWTLQEGYPVLSVTRDYNDGSASLSQVSNSNTGV
jgi:aminopeptidase N